MFTWFSSILRLGNGNGCIVPISTPLWSQYRNQILTMTIQNRNLSCGQDLDLVFIDIPFQSFYIRCSLGFSFAWFWNWLSVGYIGWLGFFYIGVIFLIWVDILLRLEPYLRRISTWKHFANWMYRSNIAWLITDVKMYRYSFWSEIGVYSLGTEFGNSLLCNGRIVSDFLIGIWTMDWNRYSFGGL